MLFPCSSSVNKASSPIATLKLPVVIFSPALYPTNILREPVVKLKPVLPPKPILASPLVNDFNEFIPTPVLFSAEDNVPVVLCPTSNEPVKFVPSILCNKPPVPSYNSVKLSLHISNAALSVDPVPSLAEVPILIVCLAIYLFF